MSTAIYSIQIGMYKNSFRLTNYYLRKICINVSKKHYYTLEYWSELDPSPLGW